MTQLIVAIILIIIGMILCLSKIKGRKPDYEMLPRGKQVLGIILAFSGGILLLMAVVTMMGK